MCADERIVLMPSGGLVGLVRLPYAQVRGLCYNRGVGTAAVQRAVCASVRIVLIPSGGLAGLVQLPCEQTCGLCLNADDVAELARRLPRAQARRLC